MPDYPPEEQFTIARLAFSLALIIILVLILLRMV